MIIIQDLMIEKQCKVCIWVNQIIGEFGLNILLYCDVVPCELSYTRESRGLGLFDPYYLFIQIWIAMLSSQYEIFFI